MSFIDSYKHLEKLCGEILNDDRRLSAYIDEMINTPNGNHFVLNWDDDLKALKHYRWVRNQISHEPGCNESNMCEPEDELWLNHFYSRIMNQTDPLSMYRKVRSVTNNSRSRTQTSYKYRYKQSSIKTKTPFFRNNIMGNYSSYIILLVIKQIKVNGCNYSNGLWLRYKIYIRKQPMRKFRIGC